MEHAAWALDQIGDVVRIHRHWMGWNLLLAFIPAGLALLLLARPHRRTLGWWIGIGVFALFLPNAPYVITDLVHLREMAAPVTTLAFLVAVLPVMAVFITLGYLSYVFCLELIVREVRSVRATVPRWAVELPVHAICALGIVLGRITRLNSWDTATHPRWTAERVLETLTWRGAPFAFASIFLATLLTYTVVRLMVVAIARTVGRAQRRATGKRSLVSA